MQEKAWRANRGRPRSLEVRKRISDGRRKAQRIKGDLFSRYFKSLALFDRNGRWGVWIKGKIYHHSRLVYEKFNGIVQKGYVIHHIDGDKKNDNPKNLMAVPKNFHYAFHRFWDAVNFWEGEKISGKKVLSKFLRKSTDIKIKL